MDPVNRGMPMFLGTPQGRVEMFDPQAFPNHNGLEYHSYGCVLVGTPVQASMGPYVAHVSMCH